MIEHCEHCQAPAPEWESAEYAAWFVGLTTEGEYLGVVCEGCFAGDELAFLGANVERAREEPRSRSRVARAARRARSR